jgi:hypothetical protein
MADDDLKNAFDNIVEDIELDLYNFIQLEKVPSRQYQVKKTSLSKLEWNRVSVKNPSWQKSRESIRWIMGNESKFFTLGSDLL